MDRSQVSEINKMKIARKCRLLTHLILSFHTVVCRTIDMKIFTIHSVCCSLLFIRCDAFTLPKQCKSTQSTKRSKQLQTFLQSPLFVSILMVSLCRYRFCDISIGVIFTFGTFIDIVNDEKLLSALLSLHLQSFPFNELRVAKFTLRAIAFFVCLSLSQTHRRHSVHHPSPG